MEPISEQDGCSAGNSGTKRRHLLSVDEEAVRPRANSDPTVGGLPFFIPEVCYLFLIFAHDIFCFNKPIFYIS
jgi:hypothetical protein